MEKVTGKYSFPGLKKWGVRGVEAALSSFGWFAKALTYGPFKFLIDGLLGLLVEWLANKGLIVLNIGAIIVEGEFDQRAFDNAMEKALQSVDIARGNLTPEQVKRIDDTVRDAFRKFARVGVSDRIENL